MAIPIGDYTLIEEEMASNQMAERLQEAKEAERAEKAERDKEAERRLKAGSYSAENELQALNLINEARALREAKGGHVFINGQPCDPSATLNHSAGKHV